MRATVYYVTLTNDQAAVVNGPEEQGGGWSGEIGRAYMAAKMDGDYTKAIELGMVQPAARTAIHGDDDFDPRGGTANEIVWRRLQNIEEPWKAKADTIQCLTSFPRSMDVGDLIVWAADEEAGYPETIMRVESIGFHVANLSPGQLPEVPRP
jgi:hypothetical protein